MRPRVIRTVSEVMGVAEGDIDDGSSPDTIDAWDSLNHMKLILALEEEFDVQFADEQIVEMLSVGLIVNALQEMTS